MLNHEPYFLLIVVYTVSDFFLNCFLNLFFKIKIKKNQLHGYLEERTGVKIYSKIGVIYLYVRGVNSFCCRILFHTSEYVFSASYL